MGLTLRAINIFLEEEEEEREEEEESLLIVNQIFNLIEVEAGPTRTIGYPPCFFAKHTVESGLKDWRPMLALACSAQRRC